MVLRLVSLRISAPHVLDLTFNNGVRKCVDVSALLEGPIFEPLKSRKYFAKAKLDAECGTVVWPNGADFAPEALFKLADLSANMNRGKTAKKKVFARLR